MNALEREFVRTTAMLLATEDYPKLYSKAPQQHADLLKYQAQLQLVLTKFFKSMAAKAADFINTEHYNYQLSQNKTQADRQALDYNVDVIINDDQIDDFDGLFINVTYKTVNNLIATGASAAGTIYGSHPAPQSTDAIIQQLTTEQVAALVGKSVQPDGSLVDNPNADYNITDSVRNDIAQAIKSGLARGLTSDEMTSEIADVIDAGGYRAERIANTEAVNAYNTGVMEYGNQSDAVGKEWQDAGASDICADNTAAGPIQFSDTFPSGDDQPPAHPNCKCAVRLIYQDEWDANGYGNS